MMLTACQTITSLAPIGLLVGVEVGNPCMLNSLARLMSALRDVTRKAYQRRH